jgi:hypothetical protein
MVAVPQVLVVTSSARTRRRIVAVASGVPSRHAPGAERIAQAKPRTDEITEPAETATITAAEEDQPPHFQFPHTPGRSRPGSPSPTPEEDAVDHRFVVSTSPALLRMLGQQRRQPFPFRIGQIMTLQALVIHRSGLPGFVAEFLPAVAEYAEPDDQIHGGPGQTG